MGVTNRDEVRDFLTTRRAKVRPDQVDVPTAGNRRVPGLRRAEVAMLAGVSVEYYARLERGNLAGVSEAVLDANARAPPPAAAEGTTRFTPPPPARAPPARGNRAPPPTPPGRPALETPPEA